MSVSLFFLLARLSVQPNSEAFLPSGWSLKRFQRSQTRTFSFFCAAHASNFLPRSSLEFRHGSEYGVELSGERNKRRRVFPEMCFVFANQGSPYKLSTSLSRRFTINLLRQSAKSCLNGFFFSYFKYGARLFTCIGNWGWIWTKKNAYLKANQTLINNKRMWIRQYCVSIHRATQMNVGQEEAAGNKFIIFFPSLRILLHEWVFCDKNLWKVEHNGMTMFSDKVVPSLLSTTWVHNFFKIIYCISNNKKKKSK